MELPSVWMGPVISGGCDALGSALTATDCLRDQAPDQVGRIDLQRLGQLQDVEQADIALAPLDRAVVGPVQARSFTQQSAGSLDRRTWSAVLCDLERVGVNRTLGSPFRPFSQPTCKRGAGFISSTLRPLRSRWPYHELTTSSTSASAFEATARPCKRRNKSMAAWSNADGEESTSS
jgi:hypothetical protein